MLYNDYCVYGSLLAKQNETRPVNARGGADKKRKSIFSPHKELLFLSYLNPQSNDLHFDCHTYFHPGDETVLCVFSF